MIPRRATHGAPGTAKVGWVERYTRWAVHNPWTVLAVGLATCIAAALAAQRLRVSSDLAALLPDDTPSVANLRLAADRLGSTDLLYIAVQSPDSAANRRYLDRVAAVVSRWPEHPLVLHKLAAGYFVEHALYYVDLADLEAIRENLRRRIGWEKVHSNPAYIDLEDSVPPEIVPQDLRDKYEHHKLVKLLTGTGEDAKRNEDRPRLTAVEDVYLEREVDVAGDGRRPSARETISVLAVRFRSSTVNIEFARHVVTRAECLIGAGDGSECRDPRHWPGARDLPAEARVVLDPRTFHPRMRVDTGGAIRTRVRETQALIADGSAAAWRSLGVMAALVFLSFRRLRALAYVLAPLVVSTTLCLALAVVLLPQLNIITVFTFAILVGMGIDFGIHLGKRYEEERRAGSDHEQATVRALVGIGRPAMIAMLTTVACFVLLTASPLPAFREFGELCALGLPLSLLIAYALFPAIATVTERMWPVRIRPAASSGDAAPSSSPALSWNGSIVALGVTLLSVVVALTAAAGLRFEYDSGKLGTRRPIAPAVDARQATRGYTASLMLALAGSPEQARELERLLSSRMDAGSERLRAVLGLSSFVPDEQQRKSLVLRDMDRLMDDPSFGFYEDELSDEEFEDLQEWRRRLRAQPVVADASVFPPWTRDLFVERDGRTTGNVVYLVPDANMGDARDARDMQHRYQAIHLPGGATVPVAATGFVYADVVFGMRQEAPWVTGLAALGILAMVLIALRDPRRALITMVPLAVGLAWLFGLMAAFDVSLTFYATVILPVVLGTGIDGAIYLHWRYLELGPGFVTTALRRTAPPVMLSSITTMAGFGSLLFAHHDGLGSMALVAVLGLGCVLAAVLLTFPPLLRVLEGRRETPVPDTAGLPEVP